MKASTPVPPQKVAAGQAFKETAAPLHAGEAPPPATTCTAPGAGAQTLCSGVEAGSR